MRSQSISPGRLLQDSFTSVAPIYKSVLLLFIPYAIFILVLLVSPKNLPFIIRFLYIYSIDLILEASTIFYIYKKLIEREVTIYAALKKGVNKFLQLLLSKILIFLIVLPASLLLIIPGIYIKNQLSFVTYAIVLEDYSATDGIKRSWQLVKGHLWSVFWALLVIYTVFWIPLVLIVLISMITVNAFGVSAWEVFQGTSPSYPVEVVATVVVEVFTLLVYPILVTYQILIFMRLLALKNREENRG